MSRTPGIRIARVGLLLLLGLAAAPGAPAQAAGITVTTIDDKIENDGKCSLREAIIAANTNTVSSDTTGWCLAGEDDGTDTITLVDGVTYDLTLSGGSEDGSASGDLDIVNNSAATDVILNAGGGTATIRQTVGDRVLHILGSDVEINGITITGGAEGDGGGIYNGGGTLTLTNSTVSSNTANHYGGGIYNTGGTVTLTNSTVSSNMASSFGGGIFNGGALTVDGSTISDNHSGDYKTGSGRGGGIFNGGVLTVDGSAISSNTAGSGGGIFNFGRLIVRNGSVIGGAGAGNSAISGGGILNLLGLPTVDGSTISDNSAETGGGIYNVQVDSTSPSVTVTGSRLLRNTASSGGDAIYGGGMSVTWSCIVGNGDDALHSGGGLPQENNNWWGQPSGPNTPGADSKSGPWIPSSFQTAPALTGCSDHLEVLGGGPGSGTVNDTTPGNGEINCTSTAGTTTTTACEAWRTAGSGTPFTLVANPASGWNFTGWAGCPSPSGNMCSLNLSSDMKVTADFGYCYTLTTGVNPPATGSVSGVPPTNCGGSFTDGTTVTLTAVPAAGYLFTDWTGCSSPSGDTCRLTLSSDTTVTANFDLKPSCGIANCSFEGPGGANQLPDSWKRGGVKLNVDGTDISTADDGSQSFRFLNAKAKAKKLYQDVVISGPAGANLDLSFSWRGDAVTGKKGLFRVAAILYYTKGGSGKFYVNMPVGTSSNWIEYHLPMTAKKAFKKLRVEIDFGKQGAAWFDNFGLTN